MHKPVTILRQSARSHRGSAHALDAESFAATIAALRPEQLQDILTAISGRDDGPNNDVAWWQATVVTESRLTRQHRRLEAASAGRRATSALRVAVVRSGLRPPDPESTRRLAQSAWEAARAIVATGEGDPDQNFFLEPWRNAIEETATGPAEPRALIGA
jgi:hypothetical protein